MTYCRPVMSARLIIVSAALAMLAIAAVPSYAATGRACFDQCRANLQRNGQWDKFPRGYCRQQCNFYKGAPQDVLRKASRNNNQNNR